MTVESEAKNVRQTAPERSVQDLQEQVDQLQSQIELLQKTIADLEARVRTAAGRYVAVCPSCQTQFDMLAHHYSIGLFDNLVYVKCPKCHKALPVKGGSGGDVAVVKD
jgi:Zn finger protein HypA/HybF involved in hydrogenase expression